MSKTKKLKALIVSALCAALMLCTGFALGELVPARAASYTLTVYGNEGGTVEVDGQTLKSAEESHNVTGSYSYEEIKAIPDEGYSFAYWYKDDSSTPLSDTYNKASAYSPTISYYIGSTTKGNLHPRFVKNEDFQTPKITTGDWVRGVDDNSYTLQSADSYNFKSMQKCPIILEFVGGGDWYSLNCTVTVTHGEKEPGNWGSLAIYDGATQISEAVSFDMGTSGQTKSGSVLSKIYGNGYHKVSFEYTTPKFTNSSFSGNGTPKKVEVSLTFDKKTDENIKEEKGTINQEIRFTNSDLGDVYYLEGRGVTLNSSRKLIVTEDEIKNFGTKISFEEGAATLTLLKDVPILFCAIGKDGQVDSTIDSQKKVSVYNGGIVSEKGAFQTKADVNSFLALSFNDEKILALEPEILSSPVYEKAALVVDIREYAFLPEVSYTTTVNGQDGTHGTLENGGTVSFDYSDENTILVEIAAANNVKEQSFTITRNGESQEYQDMQGRFGFPLNNVKERQEISILPDYGTRFYVEQPFAFTISMMIEGGEQKVVSSASDHITVIQDDEEPWFFDPTYNGEGNLYAFSSELYDDTGSSWDGKISQIGFTFTGKGQFYLEFNLLGQGYNTTAIGYAIGDKATLKSFDTFESNKGFADIEKSGINALGNSWGSDPVKFEISNADYVKELDDGWYSFALPIETTEETTLWFVHGYGSNISRNPEDRVTIRNVAFYSGDSYASWGVENAEGSGGSSDMITVKKGNDNADAGAILPGTVLTFTAKPTGGNSFYGWKLITGTLNAEGESKLQQDDPQITDSDINWNIEGAKFISYEPTYRHIVGSGYSKIVAVIDTTGTYAVRHGDTFYAPDNVTEAFTVAEGAEDKNVIVVDNATLSGITVPTGVNFVLPFNASGSYYEMGTAATATKYISWAEDVASADKEKHDKYKTPVYTLTLEGENIVNGNFYVGGVIHYPDQSAQGHTSGAYSELVLNGTITVSKDGMMDVYGRVTGRGGITVQSGATLKQPFLILDFAGGNNTYGLFDADQTPFKRYAMINIQCGKGYTIEYGGELIGHASLFFSGAITTLDQPFISYENGGTTTLINLKKSAKAEVVYTNDRFVAGGGNTENIGHTTITITGGATAGYMDFVGMVQTSGVAFSIPYNYSLVLKSGDYSFDYPYKLMPGASLTVDAGATLDLNSEFYVYDGLMQSAMSGKSYPTADALKAENAKYPTNANFIVNGKLNINANATFLGVVQTIDTTGTAQIVVKQGATLAGKIVDGATTVYDCNYSEYESSMRLFDKVHGEKGTLTSIPVGEDGKAEKDMTFTSTWTSEDEKNAKWGVSGIQCFYEAGNGATHAEGTHNDWQTGTLTAVDGLKGSWMIEHGSAHSFDWAITDEEKGEGFFGEENHKTVSRKCIELGCTEEAHKTLYKPVGTFENQVYNGSAFNVEALFTTLFGEKDAYQGYQLADGKQELKDADTYSITITLDETLGYFVVDGAFKTEATFSFTIDRKPIDVTILDQNADYTGAEPTVSQVKGEGYTAEDLCEGDSLDISITKEEGVNYKEGGYALKASEVSGTQYSNKNYTITFQYTSADHSVFTVNKVTLTVKADNKQSPKGETLQPFTVTVTGYVNGEENLLHEKDADLTHYFTFTCDASTESDPQNYDITVQYIGEAPLNYNVTYSEEKGKYAITEAVFAKVKFEDVTATYDGEEHALVLEGVEELAEPQITYTYGDGVASLARTNAGTYQITVKITVGSYNPYERTATLTIEKRDVHVTLLAQEKDYDGTMPEVSSEKDVGWQFADGSKMYGGDEVSVLGIALSATNPNKNAGSYDIATSKNDNGNYNVIFDNSGTKLYTINKKAVEVQITDVTMKYGEDLDSHKKQDGYEKAPEGVIAGESLSVTLNFDAVQNKAGEYDITGTADPATGANINYIITVKNGKFTINARTLTVVIEDQSATYNYQHQYTFDTAKWHVKTDEGDGLAEGEEKDILSVTLTKPEMTDAGDYEIAGAWDNENYTVTFEGTKQTKGTFTVEKQDVSDGAKFILGVEGDNFTTDGARGVRAKFAGEELVLFASASYFEGTESKTLEVTIDPAKIGEIGEFEVTVTIADKNYCGSTVFNVVVTDAAGYTKKLTEVLEQLETLAKGLDIDALKAEDYATLTEMYKAIQTLDEEERETGASALAEYQAYIDAWNALADTDAAVETAESIANGPIKGLFAGTAVMTALAAFAYIVKKGGIL